MANKKGLLIATLIILIIVVAVTLALVFTLKKDVDNKSLPTSSFKVVQTKQGGMEGKIIKVTRDDGETENVYRFRNVPYAEPPIRDLRWKAPKPIQTQSKTLKYSDQQIWCAQIKPPNNILNITEDCLILTIRQPESATPDQPLPVLFWIHGGALARGSSDWYYPDEQTSASLGMVTVSVNYRLGIFGFLSIKELWSTNDGEEGQYGNFGILDMIEALKWVKMNIKSFGGDPNKVTILGESGGGAAVFSLITSPLTDGLFNKAIAASGYPVSLETTFERADSRYGSSFKEDLRCSNGNDGDVMTCLREKTMTSILDKDPSMMRPLNESSWVFPFNQRLNDYPIRVIDDEIIDTPLGSPGKYLQKGLKVLIGNTAAELPPQNATKTIQGLEEFLKPRILSFTNMDTYEELMNLYRQKRPEDKTSPAVITPQLVYLQMAADVVLSCQTNDIVHNISLESNLTVYRYLHSQPLSENRNNDNEFESTAYHGIDTDVLFGIKYYYPDFNITDSDQKLILNFRQIVKDFVYSAPEFDTSYTNKTIEFWDDQILTWDKPYHEKECQVLRDNGFLKRAWGQLG
ncbi:fatty acyl-CoA hydrolase precursor, medium chain-like [Clytia hemisphaerica]|uniref:Carboxylic ester hydrolase n=1 Tax=Clytia hemisphaerica TaxID=252671 RepID=A0A7M6DR41_9CNID